MDKREKYNTLFRPAQELCNTLKNLPMAQFRDQFKIFLHVKDLFEKRIPFIPSIITTSMTSESDYITKSSLVTSELNTSDRIENTLTEELIGSSDVPQNKSIAFENENSQHSSIFSQSPASSLSRQDSQSSIGSETSTARQSSKKVNRPFH